MADISMKDLKKGLKIELEGIPYKIVEYQHVKPGKGPAFVRTKIKSLLNGRVIEKTFHAGDKASKPNLDNKTMQYLYFDGSFYQFMDTESYEQIGLSEDQIADAKNWLLESAEVEIYFHNDKPISVEVQATVVLKVTETAPDFKGDTATGGKKPAVLETGVTINVPFHILEGDLVKVDTKEASYIEKAK